jgi:transposase
VDKTRAEADFSGVTDIGVDETSCRKGHHYITLFVDVKESKVLFATEGTDKETVSRFHQDLTQHQGDPDQIENFCSDLSPAFISGVTERFPNADLTFDKFHIVKIVNEAVDEVRRSESKDNPWLKGTRYLWLKNPRQSVHKAAKQTGFIEGFTQQDVSCLRHQAILSGTVRTARYQYCPGLPEEMVLVGEPQQAGACHQGR